MLANLTLQTKQLGGFLIMALLVAIAGTIGCLELRNISGQLDEKVN